MGFCRFGQDYIKEGYTQIDNVFLHRYLPKAESDFVKVYLYGLYLAGLDEESASSVESTALALQLSEERVAEAFTYWENLGLVTLAKAAPLQVVYRSVKAPVTPLIKINSREYSVFVEEIARIFPEKVLSENELTAYMELMQQYKIETNAMILIARYCLDVCGKSGTAYILSKATALAQQGVITENAVTEHIERLENNLDDARAVLRALGLKSEPDIDDKQLFLHWTNELGFRLDAILVACRACKRKGGMSRLVRYMEELHTAGAITATEVDAYSKGKDAALKLSRDMLQKLGVPYVSYETVAETYVSPWLALGFEPNALLTLAHFCFIRREYSLDALQDKVDKLYKLGFVTESAINGYVASQVAVDASIKELLAAAGSESFVTAADRTFYRTFVELWGFDNEVLLLIAKSAYGKPFPMSYVNKILLVCKENNLRTTAEVSALLENGGQKKKSTDNATPQSYTKEELASVFRTSDTEE